MVDVVGVRFKPVGKIYYFDPQNTKIEKDSFVIVETARGIEFGKIEIPNRMVEEEKIVAPLKRVLRVATEEDMEQNDKNKAKEKDAFDICVEKVKSHNLDMKLIDVEFTFDLNKVIFYFTSDGRVDFRELVKDLASVFRTRIELRQIGVRDEAKMLSGIGTCGQTLCCSTFLSDFQPVSIRMAKEQNLSLNPAKISGICGRLMCCLKYEEEAYKELNKNLPSDGDIVKTPDGSGEVVSVNVLRQLVRVAVKTDNNDINVNFYNASEVEMIKAKAKKESDSNYNAELKKLEKHEGDK